MDRKKKEQVYMIVDGRYASPPEGEATYHVNLAPGQALGDSGARSPVGGSEWHKLFQKCLLQKGRRWMELHVEEHFKLVPGPS